MYVEEGDEVKKRGSLSPKEGNLTFSLWQYLSDRTKVLDPVTLTSNFDLLLKKT